MTMVKAKFHLLQVEPKVAPPDSVVAAQPRLRERPEVLNAVDVIAAARKGFTVVDSVVPVAVGDETVVDAERVKVDNATFGDPFVDDAAEHLPGNIWYRTGVDVPIV